MKRWFKHHVIPRQGNNYQPTILQKAAMSAMLCLVVLSFLAAGVQSMIWTNFEWMVSAVLPAVIVEETNNERGTTGALRRNPVLDRAATMKANDMAAKSYFSHYSPDGTSPWYWFNQAGYSFLHAGENLAVHFTDSEEIVDAWMNSPTHRANIMNGKFTEIGIGVAKGTFEGAETIFVVQFFGTPVQSAPLVEAAPAPAAPIVASVTTTKAPTNTTKVAAAEPEPAPATPPPAAQQTQVQITEAPTQTPDNTPEETPVETEDTEVTTPSSVEVREDAATAERPTEIPLEEEAASSFYTETITTSTEAFVGSTDDDQPRNTRTANFGFLTSPTNVLQMLYLLLGVFVALALALSLILEARRQHPVQVAYSAGLAAVMLGLFYLHSYITAGVVIA